MKQIYMSELQERDIFAFSIKLRGREAFYVTDKKEDEVICYSRNDYTKKRIKKKIKGMVILLKRNGKE